MLSVCVFCGSSALGRPSHHAAAAALGRAIGAAGARLVFGGGGIGMMRIVADAALAAGAPVLGVIPDFLRAIEAGHDRLSETVITDSMHARKQRMFEESDGFAVLPGGFGTLDELFEILTWKQLRQHDKPVVLVDVEGYWAPLIALIDHMVGERYVRAEHRHLFTIVQSPDAVLPLIAGTPPQQRRPAAGERL